MEKTFIENCDQQDITNSLHLRRDRFSSLAQIDDGVAVVVLRFHVGYVMTVHVLDESDTARSPSATGVFYML